MGQKEDEGWISSWRNLRSFVSLSFISTISIENKINLRIDVPVWTDWKQVGTWIVLSEAWNNYLELLQWKRESVKNFLVKTDWYNDIYTDRPSYIIQTFYYIAPYIIQTFGEIRCSKKRNSRAMLEMMKQVLWA